MQTIDESNHSTILIVDDTEANIEILSGLLSNNFDVMASLDGSYALEIAKEDKPDLILLDILMPEMDGYEVCRRLKSHPDTKDIPIIFITAETDEESIEKAYDTGGLDYITKPFKPKELLARVRTQLKMASLIQHLENSQKQMEILATTDHLTGLYNRRYFSEISKKLIENSTPDIDNITVLIMDIDNFKTVNDTYGHAIGDEVIKHLSTTLMQHKRQPDIVARYGGEEFTMLLPDTSINGALTMAERIRKNIEKSDVFIDEKSTLNYTISVGISKLNLHENDPMSTALLKADNALYRAKNNGKNRVFSEA